MARHFVATRLERLLLHVAVRQTAADSAPEAPPEAMPLRGSPFSIDVLPALASAQKCEALGEALKCAVVRTPASFVIVARDAHGNRRGSGG